MSGIEGDDTKQPEAPSNIISHRFRELTQPASVDQLKKLVPWKIRIVMRERKLISKEHKSQFPSWHPIHKESTTSIPCIDPELTPHGVQGRKLLDYDGINAWIQQLNGRTVHKNPDMIKTIQENDMKWSESVDDLYNTDKLGFVAADSDGRVVFLPEQRFKHIALEIRKHDWSTRFEQFVMSGIINNDIFNFLQLIHEVVTTGDIKENAGGSGEKLGYSYHKVFKEVRGLYKTKDRIIEVVTSLNGMIVTVTFDGE